MKNLIERTLKKQGFTGVAYLNQQEGRFGGWFDDWLARGYQASMDWMSHHVEIRQNPCEIEPYGRSIISVLIPYYTPPPSEWDTHDYISCYAWGADYHQVIRKRLKTAVTKLSQSIEGFKGRVAVDTAPIPEKIIAASCGLGWIGKNSLLITPEHGSFVFLGEIICNQNLASSPAMPSRCGDCDLCVSACPNNAIQDNGMVDSNRCASYLTIEKRGSFNFDESRQIGDRLFGCDACQRVCPWNQGIEPTTDNSFHCFDRWRHLSLEALSTIDQDSFDELKISSPIKRLKRDGIRRNARAVIENINRAERQ